MICSRYVRNPDPEELSVPSVDYSADFDWSILTARDPMAMVRGQLGFSWMVLAERLAEIDDQAYLCEPAPSAWSLRPRDQVRSQHSTGLGDSALEWPREGDPELMRTIAWLVAHLTDVFFQRWEWTFGGHKLRRSDLTFSPKAAEGVAQLTRWATAWQEGIAGLDPQQVFTVGLSQATEIDREAPLGHLALHFNRELIHHGAEITFVLDLHRAAADRPEPIGADVGGG